MSEATSSTVKRALAEIKTLRAELAKAKQSTRAPLAITGMALRLPGGVRDAGDFERLLFSGEDPIRDIPQDRWPLEQFYSPDPDAPGKMTTRQGGFIDDVDQFDAEFFGISPAEAASMDPQQRILLELAWEAIENAGSGLDSLCAGRTGVYLAVSNSDYGRALFSQRESIDAYYATGTIPSVAAGRIAYTLGLKGPALAVDTACSASLTALHLACQALRLGECDAALVGGANLILTPEINVCFTKGRMMSAHDRCRTFDAAADGYVRGEGAVIFLVKRLSDAQANGDRILAIVRGSALNQDGRSSGLTAPNGPAQESVIRAALDDAGVDPGSISYVEAHGTGTSLGDPIELGALAGVFANDRDESRPLLVGAVKSTIGHTEGAAGASGVAKCLVAFQRGELPPNLHFSEATPHVDWRASKLAVVDKPTELPRDTEGRCRVGVSSFGISGTNAHVILEAPEPQLTASAQVDRPAHILTLSAKSDDALRAQAQNWRSAFEQDIPPADLCFAANTGRERFERRAAVIGRSSGDFAQALENLQDGRSAPNLIIGASADKPPRIAFLFTGQGAHYPGMSKGLYETSPVFRDALDKCTDAARPHLEDDLCEALFAKDAAKLDDPRIIQPANFALQVALTELWRSWGVEPTVMLGHSLGEYAAAYAAGVFDLSDAMEVVAARGRAAELCHGKGAMLAASAPKEVVERAIAELGDLEFAAFNGPHDFAVSGEPAQIEALAQRIEKEGGRAKVLAVPFGSHSRWVEPALAPLGEALKGVTFHPAQVELANNLRGKIGDATTMSNADYWLAQMRQPVRFSDALASLAERGTTHFIEIGPHPVLSAQGMENLGDGYAWLASMRRETDPWTDLLASLQRLSVDCAPIDWRGFDAPYARKRVAAPTYPFQRRRHWIDLNARTHTASAEEAWTRAAGAALRQSEQGPLGLDSHSYRDKWDLLERIAQAITISLLCDANLFEHAEEHSRDALLERMGIDPDFVPLVTRWLDRLVDAGLLAKKGKVYRVATPLKHADLDALWAQANAAFADNQPLLAYVRHCGALASDVVKGRERPLETLFPAGSFDLAEGLYERSLMAIYQNAILAAAISAFAASAGRTRPIRILEVGAGTGATATFILPLLDHEHSYTFTDVSDAFLSRAREKFAKHRNVHFATFDFDRELSEQGYDEGSYDVIIAVNAIHASADLSASLERLQTLLAPGGVIAFGESTTSFAWFDFTTGLIEGWRQHMDSLRKDGPLLGAAAWLDAMRAAGFAQAAHFPETGASAEILGQHVILARKTGELERVAPTSSPVEDDGAPPLPVMANEGIASVVNELAEAAPVDRLDVMRAFVRLHVRAVLGITDEGAPDRNARLTDLGFDSLMAVQLRNRLTKGLEMEQPLPASFTFDYPTVEALTNALMEIFAPVAESTPAPAETTPVKERFAADEVASMSDEEIAALLASRSGGRS